MRRETSAEKLNRMTQIERLLWEKGLRVAGIDEVGRGPLAGPVVAACVILPPDRLIPGVDDSKKLSEAKRESLYEPLCESAAYLRTAWVEPERIDSVNILCATRIAMQEAAAGADGAYFLIDAMDALILPGESESIVGGDALSYSIAAASIVAKVERDRYMAALHERYPEYGFIRNKGYGTKEHIEAILRHGPCPAHRRSFISKWIKSA